MTKALFLDRDGVINVNHGYVYKIEDFEFIDGIFELCRGAIDKQYQIIIVTNQSGIARRYYGQADFTVLTRWVEKQFWLQGIPITRTYHCPHHPKQTGAFGFSCTCRKPKPGMLFKAQQSYQMHMASSIMVGDSLSDMKCAQAAGIKKRVLFKPNSLQYGPSLAKPGQKTYYQSNDLRAIRQLL